MKHLLFFLSVTLVLCSCKNKINKTTSAETDRSELDSKASYNSKPENAMVLEEYIYGIENALTPECHASTIAESNGTLITSWFGGTEEKNDDVGIWVSRKINNKWTTPVEVANGIQEDGTRFPCWNPVLFKTKDMPLTLYYKIGPNPIDWWGLYKTSNDDGKSWSEPKMLPKGIYGPIKNQPIALKDGTILSPSSTEFKADGWLIHLEISKDNGKSWTKTAPLNNSDEFGAIQPAILNYGNGKLQILSRTENDVITENWSNDYGVTWNKMKSTELPNPNSGIDATTLKDGRQLLIYNPTKKNWGDRVPLSIGISKDGKTWKRVLDLEPLTETTDKEGEEYSYPTVYPNPRQQSAYCIYLE